MFFKKTKFTPLKSINFHFKTPNKQILVFFQPKLEKTVILQKSSAMRESVFNGNLFLESVNYKDKCNNTSTKSTNILILIQHDRRGRYVS